MRRLHQEHVGGYALLDQIALHLLHGHLPGQLAKQLRSILPVLLAFARHLQLPSVEALHRTFRAPAALDTSLRHDVALTPCGQSRVRDWHCAVLLPLLDARLLYYAPLRDSLWSHWH